MTIGTKLHTFFHGQLVGVDEYGNKYYCDKKAPKDGSRQKRWVMYNGKAEPSKVPPVWHGWLHYTQELPPTKRTITTHKWEKAHQPNLTGTASAYRPQGHLRGNAEHAPTVASYQAWKP